MNKISVLPVLGALACLGSSEYEQHLSDGHCFSDFSEDGFEEISGGGELLPLQPEITQPGQGRDAFQLIFPIDAVATQDYLKDFYRNFDIALGCSLDGEFPSLEEAERDFSVYQSGGQLTNTVYVDFGDFFDSEDCEVVNTAFLAGRSGSLNCELPIPVYSMDYDGTYRFFCGVRYYLDVDGEPVRKFVYEC